MNRLTANRATDGPKPFQPVILLVEDDAPIRALVTRVLVLNGYRVLAADNASSALPIWAEHRDEIDLLLTDLMMPKNIGGRELAARCQRDKPHLKVIFTSGYNIELSTAGGWLREGLDFLQKPYRPEQLIAAVHTMLTNSSNPESKAYVADSSC